MPRIHQYWRPYLVPIQWSRLFYMLKDLSIALYEFYGKLSSNNRCEAYTLHLYSSKVHSFSSIRSVTLWNSHSRKHRKLWKYSYKSPMALGRNKRFTAPNSRKTSFSYVNRESLKVGDDETAAKVYVMKPGSVLPVLLGSRTGPGYVCWYSWNHKEVHVTAWGTQTSWLWKEFRKLTGCASVF